MKQISNATFERLIKESISQFLREAGPVGLGGAAPAGLGGSAPAGLGGTAPQGLGGSAPAAQKGAAMAGGKMKNGTFRPKIAYAWYESDWQNKTSGQTNEDVDEVLKIGIDYIYDQHQYVLIDEWAKKYSDIFTAQSIRMRSAEKGEPKTLEIDVKSGKDEEFKKIIPDVVASIEALNGKQFKYNKLIDNKSLAYDVAWFPQLEQILIDSVNKAPSKSDMNAIKDRIANTWIELLSNMQDPSTLQKMGQIGGMVYSNTSATLSGDKSNTFGDNGFSAGHQLSFANKVEVFAQDPNATFVTQEWVWRDMFNRTIINPNDKIIINKPTTRKPTDPDAFEKACVKCGYASAREFKAQKKAGNVGQSALWAVYAAYNMLNTADTAFRPVIVYDYANTQLIQGMPDIFNEKPGLVDNLKGIPNKAALSADRDLAASAGKQFTPGTMQKITDSETEAIRDILKALLSSKGISVPSNIGQGNVGDDIVKLGYAYGNFLVNSGAYNFSKDEYKEAFRQAFAAAVAATYGFETAEGAQYLRQVLRNRGTDTELKTMVNLFFEEYKELISQVNSELVKMSKKLKKAGVASAKTSNVAEEVEFEEVSESGMNGFAPVSPLSAKQFYAFFGMGEGLNEEECVEQNDIEAPDTIKESFFRMLDKIEHING